LGVKGQATGAMRLGLAPLIAALQGIGLNPP
jgi:hypothetical protein